jgi:autotransporter-associated beta strand protein
MFIMQTKKSLYAAALCFALFYFSRGAAQAGNVFKADVPDNLNLATSWSNSVAPTASDIATWDQTVQVNTTSSLGANLAWAGIEILNPAGLITLSAGNTLTNGASGINLSLATNGLTLDCPVVLSANQSWIVTNGQTLTTGGAVSGSSTLTLNSGGNDNGTIVLGVANTYSGGTIISSGIVQPNNASSFGTGGITNNGGTLRLNGFPASGIIANTFNVTGTTILDTALLAQSDVLDGAWSGSGTVLISNAASGLTLTLGGNGNGGGNFTGFTGTISVVENASGTPSAGSIRFNNGGANNNLGNPGMTLNLGVGSVAFTEKNAGDTTSFGALSGGPNTTLAKGENYSIGALNQSTTFAGQIQSTSSLTKVGTGTFILTGNNPYTGATTVSAGILQVGDGVTTGAGALGTGAVTIAATGELLYNKPDNFAVNNNISGPGPLIQTNTSVFTYNGNDSGSGTALISQGTLQLGASGLMSCPVFIASGATFDVSQNSTFALDQELSGFGTVNGLLTAAGGVISPGGTGVAGTLTFTGGLTESGNVNNQLELSTPGSTNDLINVTGGLTLSGVNNITLSAFGGGTIPFGTYPLITYTGALSGGTNNFAVTAVGVTGTLTNITTTTPAEIAVIISVAMRGPTNLTWKGDGVLNDWDTTSTNWVSGATPFTFRAGDSVLFNDSGAPNTNVNLVTAVVPAAVVASNTQHYFFNGIGSINGSASLVKTNSGTLSILATNSYTGPTIVGGGTLEAFNLTNGGSASAIGAATSNPTNLVFFGSVFKYSGSSTATDRGATLDGAGVTVDVTNGTDLTLNGPWTGPGALALTDTGTLSFTGPNTYLGGTVLSNGILAATTETANISGFGPTNSPITFNGGTLTLDNSASDDGSTVFSFFNPLIVPTGQTGTLNVFQRGDENGALTGSGTLNVIADGQRGSFAGNWSAFAGTIHITGNFRIENTFGYSNAIIQLADSADLDGGTSSGTFSSSPTFNIGELDGTSLSVIGNVSKPTPFPTWCVGWLNTTSIFAGTIQNPSLGVSSITKVGTGIWYLSGQNTFTGSTIISDGVLALTNGVNGDGSIADSTNIFINAGAFLDVSGRSDGTLPLDFSQVLSGKGTIRGILDTTSGGTVSPGGGINGVTGTLTVTNNINLGGTTWMKIDTTGNDELVSSHSSITYGGTLVVTNIGGDQLHPGETFTLFSGANLDANTFSSIVLPDYYTWNTGNLGINGTISVATALTPPRITTFTVSPGSITLFATNGAPNGPYEVLASTNAALPITSWTNVASGNFDPTGVIPGGVNIPVDTTIPGQFFILQVQ